MHKTTSSKLNGHNVISNDEDIHFRIQSRMKHKISSSKSESGLDIFWRLITTTVGQPLSGNTRLALFYS